MDKTINKIIIGFIVLILFDCTTFKIEKTRFGLFDGIITTVGHVKKTIGLFR